jgi:cytosine/creatinine deaminase
MTESVPPQPHQPRKPDGDSAGSPGELLLSGARLSDGRIVDVRLHGGRIEAVGTAGSLTPPPTTEGTRVDLSGYLLLPAPAEPHAHLDTALTADTGAGPPTPKARGGPPSDDPEDVQRRVTEAALLQLGHGTTAMRTHVRIGGVQELNTLGAVLKARRSLRDLVCLSTVAMPRVLTGAAGAAGLTILRDALKMGAQAVGGCPDLDPDPAGYAEAVLGLAAEFGCPVDLHTDGDSPARLARLAAMAGGLRPRVTIGPCTGLARLPQDVAARTAEQLAAAGVSVVCLPQGSCGALQQGLRGAYRPGLVRMLHAAGVRVTAGSGALRDAANPVGRADPIEAAFLLASYGECEPSAAYEAVSARARTVLGLPQVRVAAGFPAELLAVRGQRIEGVLSLGHSKIVIHRGRVVSRTSAVREYADCAVAEALDLPRQWRSGA